MKLYPEVFFFKGTDDVLADIDKTTGKPLDRIKESFAKILDGKNLSFLLGSGCSSFIIAGKEIGIPTMAPLAKESLIRW